jgi:DNA polymerase elongation subunit (family B)
VSKKPKVLIFDVETAPVLANVWSLWEQNIGLNQIKQDWFVLSWSAKWLGDSPSKVMYQDQRGRRNIEDDKELLKGIWKLLDEADVVITQNGKKFDSKKLNARFVINGMKPPSPYKHIDTVVIARKVFGFTSNKLEYMTNKLCKKYKKLKHNKFSGFELWKECLAGNPEAWEEMEKYNRYDVLSLEELYNILSPWDQTVNFNLYHDEEDSVCNCGSTKFTKRGYAYTSTGKYQRYVCNGCGAWSRSSDNEFTKEKRSSLRRKV